VTDKFIRAPLPDIAAALCNDLKAPPRLRAHLTLVHDAAFQLCNAIDRKWPKLAYDRDAVLIGAATHDLGKVLHPSELVGPGEDHERDGPALMLKHGLRADKARFAGTHGRASLKPDATLEDMIVALADAVWKGARRDALEKIISVKIASLTGDEVWNTFMTLDSTIQAIAKHAEARLEWQQTFES
jgi:hypothetical protein